MAAAVIAAELEASTVQVAGTMEEGAEEEVGLAGAAEVGPRAAVTVVMEPTPRPPARECRIVQASTAFHEQSR